MLMRSGGGGGGVYVCVWKDWGARERTAYLAQSPEKWPLKVVLDYWTQGASSTRLWCSKEKSSGVQV